MQDSASSRPRRPRRRSKFLVALAIVPVAAFAAEGGLRLVLRARGTPYHAAGVRERIQGVLDRIDQPFDRRAATGTAPDAVGERIVHPYAGWTLAGADESWLRQHAAIADARARGIKTVMLLGGSVAAMLGNEHWLIEIAFAKDLPEGERILVFPQPYAAYKQPQQLELVAYLFSLGLRPDVVLNVDGFNEVALAVNNADLGVWPAYPDWLLWGPLMTALTTLPEGDAVRDRALEVRARVRRLGSRARAMRLDRSALAGTWAASRLLEDAAEWVRLEKRWERLLLDRPLPLSAGRMKSEGDEQTLALAVRVWEESSRSIRALCAERGIAYAHVLQPTLHDKGSKPLTEQEIATSACRDGWRRGAELGYPLLREAGGRLQEAGVSFLDGSMIFADLHETTYIDSCHFEGEGIRRLAVASAHAVRAALDGRVPEAVAGEVLASTAK